VVPRQSDGDFWYSTDSMRNREYGCDVSSDCLQCPLELCKHDNPVYYRRWKRIRDGQVELGLPKNRKEKRIMEVKLRIAEGISAREIAKEHGISIRTVRRYAQT